MNEFEMEFINDLKRLKMKRFEVCSMLNITMPTLKAKLRSPNNWTIGEVKKLKKLEFNLKGLGI